MTLLYRTLQRNVDTIQYVMLRTWVAATLHLKSRPNRCRYRDMPTTNSIMDVRHRPIQRYHCRPPTTYDLAIIHAFQTTDNMRNKRQTDIDDTSYLKLDLTVSQKPHNSVHK